MGAFSGCGRRPRNMLENVEWGKPLHAAQAQCIAECAAWVGAGIDNNPFQDPVIETLALVSVCDALLDWVRNPQDQDLIDRVMKALKVHWDFCADE